MGACPDEWRRFRRVNPYVPHRDPSNAKISTFEFKVALA
jgi:hypothetical protein